MDYGDRFKTTMFGGFDKEDVLICFDQMIADYQKSGKDLHEQLEKAQKEASLYKEKTADLEQQLEQLHEKHEKLTAESQSTRVESEKVTLAQKEQIAQLTSSNRRLNDNVLILQNRLSQYTNLEEERKRIIEQAENAARDRTNQIIVEAKQKVEVEYQSRLNVGDQKAQDTIQTARTHASELLEKAKTETKTVLDTTVHDSEIILLEAEKKANQIIQSANQIAGKLIDDARDSALNPDFLLKNVKSAQNERQLFYKTKLENLKQRIGDEVDEAVSRLGAAQISMKLAKSKVETLKDVPNDESLTGVVDLTDERESTQAVSEKTDDLNKDEAESDEGIDNLAQMIRLLEHSGESPDAEQADDDVSCDTRQYTETVRRLLESKGE